MPDHPWRCSECGTINEPVANSCRTCGKWPSLFDLQDSVVDEIEVEDEAVAVYAERAEHAEHAGHVGHIEVGELERQIGARVEVDERRYDRHEHDVAVPVEDDVEEDKEVTRRRNIISYLVPLAFVVYLVLSVIFSNR